MEKKHIYIVAILVVLFFFFWKDDSSTTAALTATDYMDLGYEYLYNLNYEKAILAFEEAIDIDPKLVEAYTGLATVYTELGDYEAAEAVLLQGLENAPDSEDLMIHLTAVQAQIAIEEHSFSDTTTNEEDGLVLFDDGNSDGITGVDDSSSSTVADTQVEAQEATPTFQWEALAEAVANHTQQYQCEVSDIVEFNSASSSTRTFNYTVLTDRDGNMSSFSSDNILLVAEDFAQFTNLTKIILSFFESDEPNLDVPRDELYMNDISFLANLTNLTYLDLRHNSISDLSPLANLTNLTYLHLYDNLVVDVTPLANLSNLTSLYLADNFIVDVTPLTALTNLETLDLSGNQITDANCLSALTNAQSINIRNNAFTSIDGFIDIYQHVQGYGYEGLVTGMF